MSMTKTKKNTNAIKSPLDVSRYKGSDAYSNTMNNILSGASHTNAVPTHDVAEYNQRLGKLTNHLSTISTNLSNLKDQQTKAASKLKNCDTAIHATAQDNDANANVISGSLNNLTKADNMLNTNISNLNNNIARYSMWVKYSGIGITLSLLGVVSALIF